MSARIPSTLERQQQESYEQTEALRLSQDSGTVETIPASRDASRQIASHDADYVHVDCTTREHNAASRRYTDRVETKTFYPSDFTRMEKEGAFAAYSDVRVIHHPGDAKPAAKASPAGNDGNDGNARLTPKQQLQARYTELFGEAPADKLNQEQLRTAIAEQEARIGAE